MVDGKPVAGLSASTPANATGAANSIVSQLIAKNAHLSDVQRQLLDRINALLQNGVSMSQIVSTLASNLANQVGAALGKSDDASIASLKTAFASALSPPGNGPPDAAALLDRLRQTARKVTAALNNSTGQQNRFPGNTLDANTAIGNPAPDQTQATAANLNGAPARVTPESVLAGAVAALGGPIDSPQNAAQLAAATQAQAQSSSSVPVAGTQSTVASSSLDPAGTGGGTLLGRTLTRAANAATNVGPNPLSALNGQGPAGALNPSATSQQTASDGKGGSANLGGTAANAFVASGGAASAPNATVAAFLQAFQRMVAANANLAQTAQPLTEPAKTDDAAPAASPFANGQSVLAAIGLGNAPSPSTPATIDSPVAQQTAPATDPNQVVAQLLRGVNLRDLGTSSEIRLRLIPESLGDLNVKLTVDHSGSVSASVLAQTPDARDALLANQGQLSRSLNDAGLKLTSFNVDLSNGGTNLFGQQSQPQQQPRNVFGLRSMLASDDAGIDSLTAAPSFAPPTAAAIGAGTLNYLV